MATYGLTPTGFLAKSVAQIVTDINSFCYANISTTLDLSATSTLGQLIGICANAIAECWNVLQAVYSAYDPNQAAGDQLASLALITGTIKRGATFSVAKLVTVNLNAGVTLPAGSQASVVGNPNAVFASTQAITNAGGSPANVSVNFQATTAGAVLALAGTLTVIAVPVSGWNSVTNPTDAIAGLPIEADSALRLRRVTELSTAGVATAAAVRSQILTQLGQSVGGDVISATVLFNDTDATDLVSGLPPHSIECIVLGALMDATADTALVAQILLSKDAGDQAFGSTLKVVNDSQGNAHTIGFTRPSVIPVYVNITVTRDPLVYPSNGNAQVAAALSAFAQSTLTVGVSVAIERIKSLAFAVPGVLDVPTCTIGLAPSPVGTVNIAIGLRQIATISTGNVNVTALP